MVKNRLELEELLKSTDIQVFYRRTTTKDIVNFPFIVYFDTRSNNLFADNVVYSTGYYFNVILHSDKRDEEAENKIANVLNENMIPFDITSINWDEDISMWVTNFEFGLLF